MSWAKLLGLAALALCGSCGWHAGLELPPGARNIGLEYFANDSLEPDLEADLAFELSQFLSSHVDAPLASPEHADVVVRGRVLNFRRRGGARSRQNELLEAGVRIDASAELVRRADGLVLARSASGVWSSYTTDQVANELDARQRALQHVAEALVLDLLSQASYEGAAEEAVSAEVLDELLP